MHVLVLGGRGVLGKQVCESLVALGHTAQPFGRRDGDLRDPRVIAAAKAPVIVNCAGASVALGLGHGWRGYRAVDVPVGLAAVRAARITGARLVYVGAHHTPKTRDTAYIDAHEQVAQAMQAIDGHVVRATGFFSVFAALLPMARRGLLLDIGDGRRRTNPISEHDLAAVVADIAIGGGPRELGAGGPEILTRREIFESVAVAAGRGGTKIRGMPIWFARAASVMVRAAHPRIGQFMRFAVGLAQADVIAPTLGTTKLADYLAPARQIAA